MTIDVAVKNDIVVLTVTGRMIFDPSLFRLREAVKEALEKGNSRFIVDLSQTSHLDSSACGELIKIHSSIARAQGILVVVKPQPKMQVLFERIRLNEVFKLVDSLQEAEAAVSG